MAFDLGAALAAVSESDTTREHIQYIPLSKIDSDEHNFYKLTNIEDLAANIATVGLQQPIRVRENPDTPGRYLTVSGHRRRAALELLVQDAPERWAEVPCIVESDAVSPALQQLRLIYANANTRHLTPAEISEQAVQVEKLLYQLKEEGYDFPGRMRDHVAQAVGASKTKLARLKVIRGRLIDEFQPAFADSQLGESTAYALAQLSVEDQSQIWRAQSNSIKYLYESSVQEYAKRFDRIAAIQCPHGGECSHAETMREKACKDRWTDPCRGCCLDCVSLQTCKTSCPHAVAKKVELRSAAQAAKQEAKRREEERNAPKLELIRKVYERIGKARKDSGVTVEQFWNATLSYFSANDETAQLAHESRPDLITDSYMHLFGNRINYADAAGLIAVADLLDVSIDYLLGRDDLPKKVSGSDTEWHVGTPTEDGLYFVQTSMTAPDEIFIRVWSGRWELYHKPGAHDELLDGAVTFWMRAPEV